MNIEDAIACLKAQGYRVSKPRKTRADLCMEKIVAHQSLNAVGKPYGNNYDPNYRMRYRTPRLQQRQEIGDNYIRPAQWEQMCKLAKAQWNQDHPDMQLA